jgi:hypothetical protein
MGQAPIRDRGRIKRGRRGAEGAGKGVYTGAKLEVYSCFPARAGSLKLSLFLLINRV